MEKGINTNCLLNSNVFLYKFELDEWPQNHACEDKIIAPYNKSIFNLRENYNDCFPELKDHDA